MRRVHELGVQEDLGQVHLQAQLHLRHRQDEGGSEEGVRRDGAGVQQAEPGGLAVLLPASDMRRALIKAASKSKPQGALAHMEAAFDVPEAVFIASDKSVPDDGSDAIEK